MREKIEIGNSTPKSGHGVQFIGLGILLVIIIIVLAYLLLNKPEKEQPKKSSAQTEQAAPVPCEQVDTMELVNDLAAINQLAAQKAAELAAARKCQDKTLQVVVKIIDERTTKQSRTKSVVRYSKSDSKPAKTVSMRSRPSTETVESEFLGADNPPAISSVREGSARLQNFCVNVKDMEQNSFWPHLGINVGDEFAGAVLNSEKNGYNIAIYPVSEISGLYGVTTDGRVFVQADLLDKFKPTIIKMSGDPNNWDTWETAYLENGYYVAYLK